MVEWIYIFGGEERAVRLEIMTHLAGWVETLGPLGVLPCWGFFYSVEVNRRTYGSLLYRFG